MRPISARVRRIIDADPFYKRCCISGRLDIELHHVWKYGGKQIDEAWAIVPLSKSLHGSHPSPEVRERCELISLQRATPADLAKYPKKDWAQILKHLTVKYEAR